MLPRTKLGLLFLACLLFAAVVQAAELQPATQNDLCSCPTVCRSTAQPVAAQQYWQLYHSANFTVCCPRSLDGHAAVLQCESLRRTLSEKWLGTAVDDWASRCYVVLHPTATTYVQAAGRGSEHTAGCSTVKELGGRVLSRRIDLRLDRPDPLSRTLPHELTHVVLADAIVGHKLPRWADEGMAMLADPQDKREGHHRDLIVALSRGAALRLPEMLTMDDYPEPQQTAAFYGQSLSLVEFLIQRKGSLTLQQFLASAARDGYQKALDETYGIRDAHELERLWLANVYRGPLRPPLMVAAVERSKANRHAAEPAPALPEAPAVPQ
jgi:hypothetical protein